MSVNDTVDTAVNAAAKEWKPKIVAFCCNWCSYAGADLAGCHTPRTLK